MALKPKSSKQADQLDLFDYVPKHDPTQDGRMAEKHWREFLSKRVRELEAKGQLREALYEGGREDEGRNGPSHKGLSEAGIPRALRQDPTPFWAFSAMIRLERPPDVNQEVHSPTPSQQCAYCKLCVIKCLM
jgi:hypothetical protein